MNRKTAERLMSLATRDAILAVLPEAMAAGKAARKNAGQESLFADEEENDALERDLKMDADIIRGFNERLRVHRSLRRWPTDAPLSREDDRLFWEYHQKKAKAGK